jgi:hypothetical protein
LRISTIVLLITACQPEVPAPVDDLEAARTVALDANPAIGGAPFVVVPLLTLPR